MTEPTTKHESNGRDASGRFVPGNKIGRGRPRREIEKDFLQAFVDGCPASTLQAIVARMTEKALTGDVSAARLILSHAMPDKQIRVELASNEAEYRVAGQTPREHLEQMLAHINARVAEMRAQPDPTNGAPA